MILKLLQNVCIDGTVVNAGTVIDTVESGVDGPSMIHWQWAEEHNPNAPAETKVIDTTTNAEPNAKPKRKPRK